MTLIDNPPDDSRVVKEEPFGPILPLLKFSTVDEAVDRANDKPMAGHKQSGIGVENGLIGLLEYTVPQTLSIKKL